MSQTAYLEEREAFAWRQLQAVWLRRELVENVQQESAQVVQLVGVGRVGQAA